MTVERVTDASLWVRLAWNAVQVIRQGPNLPRLEHYWVEDFIPDRPLTVEDGAIQGTALIMEHEDAGQGFTRYAMTVRLGERALDVFARGQGYEGLVPADGRTDWLTLDTDTKHVTISLD